jgi:hypothetical protein
MWSFGHLETLRVRTCARSVRRGVSMVSLFVAADQCMEYAIEDYYHGAFGACRSVRSGYLYTSPQPPTAVCYLEGH